MIKLIQTKRVLAVIERWKDRAPKEMIDDLLETTSPGWQKPKYFPFKGESMTIKQIAARLGASPQLIQTRLNRGWSIEDAGTKAVHDPGVTFANKP